MESSVPANTMLDGKLLQLFMTLLIKQLIKKVHIVISKNCFLM